MKPEQFIRRFSHIVYEDSSERGLTTRLLKDLVRLHEIMLHHSSLKFFLESRKVTTAPKTGLLKDLPGLDLHEYSMGVLTILIDHGRMNLIGKIADRLRKYREDDRTFSRVRFRYALHPGDAVITEIRERLAALLKREIEFDHSAEPELVGGMTLKIDNVVIDGSLATQLEHVRHLLKRTL